MHSPRAVLLGVVALTRGQLPRGRPLTLAAISGLLMVTLTFEGIAEGTKLAGAGNAAVLVNTTPFFVLVFGRAFFGERIAGIGVIGLVTAFVGVVTMISSQIGGEAETADLVVGMSIALLAGAGFGVGTLIVKATTTRYPETDLVGFTAAQHLIGGLALVPLALAYGDIASTTWSSGELWASIAWVSIGSSAIASLAYFTALRLHPRDPGERVAVPRAGGRRGGRGRARQRPRGDRPRGDGARHPRRRGGDRRPRARRPGTGGAGA